MAIKYNSPFFRTGLAIAAALILIVGITLFTNLESKMPFSSDSLLDALKEQKESAAMGEIQKASYAEAKTKSVKEIKTRSDKESYLKQPPKKEHLTALKTPIEGKIHNEIKNEIKKKKPEERIKVIIEVEDENELAKVSKIVEKNGGNVQDKLEVGDSIIADVPAGQMKSLADNENVQGIWPEKEYSVLLDTSVSQINANSAWELGYNGSGVKVAVLDTGIDDTNEMLSGKVVAAEVFTEESHTIDKQGHGTHIAGIIAGNGMYKGVAPAAMLMNVKVLTDKGSGTTSTIIKGINWAVANNADIISISFGGAHNDSDGPINAALKEAMDAGIIVVISSGNCGEGCPSGTCGSFRGVTKPGDFKDAITVGAVDKNNNWACFSSGQKFENYIKPDLAAPGVDITSSFLGNNYKAMSGTSMSAPFVSGVAALLLQKNESYDTYAVKSLLESTAIDLYIKGKDIKFGSGIVDAKGLFLAKENETEDIDVPEQNNTMDNDTTDETMPSNGTIDIIENNKTNLIAADIKDFKFVDIKELDRNELEIESHQRVLYENNQELVKVEELIFSDAVALREYLYMYYPMIDYSLDLIYDYKDIHLISYDNALSWFNNNKLYEVSYSNDSYEAVLDEYLGKVESQVGKNLTETKENLKLNEFPVDHEMVIFSDNGTEIGKSDMSNPDNSIKTIAFANESGNFTVQASCSDFSNTNGACSPEGGWGVSNSHSKLWKCTDMIWIGTLLCWKLESQQGYGDFCPKLKSHTSYRCEYNWGDCDNTNECSGSLQCKAGDWFWQNDGCCNSGQKYDGSYCYNTCPAGWLNEYRCSSDQRQRKYQNSDCSTEWRNNQNCNDDDSTGNWNYFCPDEDNVKKKRTVYNGYCDSGTNSCKISSDEEKQSVSQNGYGDFCAKRNDHGCTLCAAGKYDCDFGWECSSSLSCKGPLFDLSPNDYDGCCSSGQEWDNINKVCYTPCVSHNYKACSDNDVYWYNSCRQKEEKVDDCQEPSSICTSDNGGGRYYDGFCRNSDATCQYNQFEACNDCSNGLCAFSCDMSSAAWSTSSAVEGTLVTLTANGDSDCNGRTASFSVWDLDCGYDYSAQFDCNDEGVSNNPNPATFSSGKAETTWTAQWQDDGFGADPNYYFIAAVGAETIRSNTPELIVSKCQPHASKQCYNGHPYYYNSCGAREEEAQHCGDMDKCVDKSSTDASCEWKTCEELGYDAGSCPLPFDSNCISDSVYDCNDIRPGFFDIQLCYVFKQQCGENQFCREDFPIGASCQDYQCSISSSSWSTENAFEDDNVTLTANGEHCSGKTAKFEIWESDCLSLNPSSLEGQALNGNESINQDAQELNASGNFSTENWKDYCPGSHLVDTINNVGFSSNKFETNWKAKYEDDIFGMPDYYFNVIVNNNELSSSSNVLKVSKKCALTSAYWNDTEVNNGEKVLITITGNHCDNGDTANVKIMEVDDILGLSYDAQNESNYTAQGFWDWLPGVDDDVEDLGSKTFSNGKIQTVWTARNIGDNEIPMHTYRIAAKNDHSQIYQGDLIINLCSDNDNDGYGNGCSLGSDCNDNDISINPGASEACNDKDDNCNSQVDEAFNKQNDVNNCGDCGNVCNAANANNACSSGQCSIGSCNANYANCNNNYWDGCEININSDANNCNGCNIKCEVPNANEACISKVCAISSCQNNYGNCDNNYNNGCEAYLLTDPNNCGGCGIEFKCAANEICSNGACEAKAVCDNDGVCETGENEISCSNDCGCNNNGACQSNRNENQNNCPNDCRACSFPDGSSYNCECDSDVECLSHGDYYCNQVSGPDKCEQINYYDECSNYNDYFCEGGDVKQCLNNGKFWEKKTIDRCTGKYEYCDPEVVDGTWECSKHPENLDVWIDYADTGVTVNKQPGDKLKLNIYSDNSATVKITYDKDVFSSIDCFTFHPIFSGINACNLIVKENIGDAEEEIKVENTVKEINIINNPELLIITDSEKLSQEYYQEPNGVKAVLKQAYANAEKDNGVVYDLRWYKDDLGASNPFTSFINYVEKIIKPNMVDNSYSIAVSNFIKEKCGNCKDVMIVGDDFVVPHYRRDIPTLTRNWFFWMKEDLKNIYTDIPYTKKSMLYLSEYKEIFKNTDIVAKEGKYEGKDVLFILPDSITTEQRTQVERLKKAFNDKGYKPNYSEMRGKDTFCLDETWFKNVSGRTLIIIGTEENNNAFKCMPFVAGDTNLDSAFMQPNVWDNQEYALVINTDNPKIIGALADMVETGEIINLKSESAYFFKVGVEYASYAALGVGIGSLILFTGGTAAPALLISAGAILDTIADSGDVADTCVVNNEGNMWCGGTIALAALPYVPSKPVKNVIKKFGGDAVNNQLKKLLDPIKDLIKKHFKKVRKVVGNIAFENGIKTIDDNIHVAKGAEYISKKIVGGLDKFHKILPGKEKLRLIKKIGKYENIFTENAWWVRTGSTKTYRGIPKSRLGFDDPTDVFEQGLKARGNDYDLLSHISGHPNSGLIPTSKYGYIAQENAAKEFTEGFVFEIDTRALNGADIEKTFEPLYKEGKIDKLEWEFIIQREGEISIIDSVDPEDIIGYRKINFQGKPDGDFVANPKYIKSQLDDIPDLFKKYLKKLRESEAIGLEAFDKVVKTSQDEFHIAKGANKLFGSSDNVDNLINKKIRFEDNIPENIRQYQRATYIKSVGKIDDGLERMEDAALRNKLNDKSKKLIDEVETNNNLANSRGLRGEIESLSHENLDDVEDISRKFTDAEKQFIGVQEGEIDILRKNYDIVETKFVKMTNLKDGLQDQTQKFVDFQKYHGKDSAQIIFRQKTDLTIKSQSELSTLIPEDVKSILNGFQESFPNKVHLEIIDLEGNLWRFS